RADAASPLERGARGARGADPARGERRRVGDVHRARAVARGGRRRRDGRAAQDARGKPHRRPDDDLTTARGAVGLTRGRVRAPVRPFFRSLASPLPRPTPGGNAYFPSVPWVNLRVRRRYSDAASFPEEPCRYPNGATRSSPTSWREPASTPR